MEFLIGKMQPFEDLQIKEDYWFAHLIRTQLYDDCIALLSIMLSALAVLPQEKFRDQLSEGMYSETSLLLTQETAHVPIHNKKCDTVFAKADFLLHSEPNFSTIPMESYIMFSFNKSAEWLNRKDKC